MVMTKRSFFETYADEYDWLTDAASREKNHEREVGAMIERYHPKSVLDAGCATGLTTMLFARKGVRAIGLDRSQAMLEVARRKFARSPLPMTFVYGSFERLPRSLDGKFDLIVCLANSISGVDSIANLKRAFRSFNRVLKPGGSLVLQMLNYRSVKEGEIQTIRSTEHHGILYLRYMERDGSRISLHIVRVDTNVRPAQIEPFRSEFDGFSGQDIVACLRLSEFGRIKKSGDLNFGTRFSRTSRDLVVTATKMA